VELHNRWAVVTGAARRIGRAIALELAGRGASVVVHHRTSAAEAAAVVREIERIGGRAMALAADLRIADDVVAFAHAAEAATGGVSVLVNNASTYLRTPWETLDGADFDAALDVNLKAPFLLSLHLGRAMRRRGEGRVVNIADAFDDRPVRGYLPYSVAKAGLLALTRALALELAPEVLVNAVAPGPVLLPEGTSPDTAAAVERATPLGRLGAPQEVARCVRFLIEEATFSTGAVVTVDGGRTLR